MIKIDENYWLGKDQYCWILNYESTRIGKDKETGDEKEITSSRQGFHADIYQALRAYADQAAKTAEAYDHLIAELEKIDRTIKSISWETK
jgi:hypothetical protein